MANATSFAEIVTPSSAHYRITGITAKQTKLPFSVMPLLNDKLAGLQLVVAL